MSKQTSSNIIYPNYAKIWFLLYLLADLAFGFSFIYTHHLVIPYIAFALINLYGIIFLIKANRQGFYTLISAQIIFLIYTLLTKKPSAFLSISAVNFFFLLITWICSYSLWTSSQSEPE